ncbi:AbrB family transcriptional regulator [Roseococcus microcysteis]|uniref:AbrB family transcriptional regulator n=1 Tax=Roseococcus microcysteis TaxID=2771361 RepID=UPI00168BD10C|nr:AbrB family transcriptional regulator [Roseococcus microcysteis]
MSIPPRLVPHLLTLAAALTGGTICHLLSVPLAWMIGAMAGTAALAWFRPVAVHPYARPGALIVLGLAFGQTFSGPVLGALLGAMPVILIAGLLSIAAGVAAVPIFTRLAGVDPRTGYFAAVPGGVIVMVVLAQRAGAPIAPVTLAQTIRVVIVVLAIPPLLTAFAPVGDATAFLAPRLPFDLGGLGLMLVVGLLAAFALRRTGIANPWMIGPCALAITAAAMGHLPSSVPTVLVDAAQVAMGATLGQRLTREFLLSSRRLLWASVMSAFALCVLCLALGAALGWASGLPVGAVMLGMAPGGMPEMGITAKTLELAVPLVLGFHLARTLMCNFLIGPVWTLTSRLGWK